MNNKQAYSTQQSKLHFKQWSNKGYAAFCSMGKVVHIGNLAISLTQRMGNAVELIEETIRVCLDREHDDADEDLLEQEFLQVIPVFTSAPVVCIASVFSKNKNINCR